MLICNTLFRDKTTQVCHFIAVQLPGKNQRRKVVVGGKVAVVERRAVPLLPICISGRPLNSRMFQIHNDQGTKMTASRVGMYMALYSCIERNVFFTRYRRRYTPNSRPRQFFLLNADPRSINKRGKRSTLCLAETFCLSHTSGFSTCDLGAIPHTRARCERRTSFMALSRRPTSSSL